MTRGSAQIGSTMAYCVTHTTTDQFPICSTNAMQKTGLPSCPLQYVPYFHGKSSNERLQWLLQQPGDFLLYLDNNNSLQPSLLAKDKTKVNRKFTIEKNNYGIYWIRKSDVTFNCRSIEILIRTYVLEERKLSDVTKECVLRNAVNSPEIVRSIQVECLYPGESLSYQYETLKEEYLDNMLKENGDFLIETSDLPTRGTCITVKWYDQLRSVSVLESSDPHWYALPKEIVDQPVEHVESLDVLLKTYVRCQIPFNGIILKRPIIKRNDSSSISEDDSKSANPNQGLRVDRCVDNKRFGLHNLLNQKAPRPLQYLPYFHGSIYREEAQSRLQQDGQYLLYCDMMNGKLFLTAMNMLCGAEIVEHREIKVTPVEKYFYMKKCDRKLKCTTVEHLVEYYKIYKIPLQGEEAKEEKLTPQSVTLENPVPHVGFQQSLQDSNSKFFYNLTYYHGSLSDNEAKEILKKEGDFLLRVLQNGKFYITVKWDGQLQSLEIPEANEIGTYTFPRLDETYPVEDAVDLEEYIQFLVTYQIPWRKVVLRKPVFKFKHT